MNVNFTVPFACPDSVAPHLKTVFEGEYEIPFFGREPQRIIDLGANCGAFSLWALHRWPGSVIWAYEPHPKTFEFLEENLSAYPNVLLHNYAVGTPGMRPLYEGKENCGESSLHHMPYYNPAPTGQHVEVRSPLELHTSANILKVDTEGCEVEIIRPLIEEGRRFDAIMFEWHCHEHRRELDQLLGSDYILYDSSVAHPTGRGLSKYIRGDLL